MPSELSRDTWECRLITEVETGEQFSSESEGAVPHKHFLNSFDKKQLINILVGGIRYFFYPWLTSSKPKHKKDKREKKRGRL